jgi:hypothetical protein
MGFGDVKLSQKADGDYKAQNGALPLNSSFKFDF